MCNFISVSHFTSFFYIFNSSQCLTRISIRHLPQYEAGGCQLFLQVLCGGRFAYTSLLAPGGLRWFRTAGGAGVGAAAPLHVELPMSAVVTGEVTVDGTLKLRVSIEYPYCSIQTFMLIYFVCLH